MRLHKHLGQNFLKNKHIAEKIVKAVNIQDKDVILEIGPGDGILTQYILDTSAQRVIAVEIDHRFSQLLLEKFSGYKKFEIYCKDFLEFADDFFENQERKIKIIGNLPYYITSPILFTLLDYRSKIITSVFTVQKEVADRLTSDPDSKSYGIPSVLFQLYTEIEQLFTISRNAFFPAPEVDSAVIKINFREKTLYPLKNEKFFRIMIQKLFRQRRKMIKNTIQSLIPEKKLSEKLPIDIRKRPENLTIEQFVTLSNELYRISEE